jgi:spore coat polysaccharide biosynthesis protein SpsF
MNITAIVQARVTSSRLPGKVLMPLCGLSALEVQIRRVFQMRGIQRVVVAIPDNRENDLLESSLSGTGASVFRGDPVDVLSRTHQAAQLADSDVIVRIPGDKPLFDPEIGDSVISAFGCSGCDYAANNLSSSIPHGFDCEVFTKDALEQAVRHSTSAFDREHVTPFIKREGNRFKILDIDSGYAAYNNWRFTLDYREDFELIETVYRMLDMPFLDVRINDVINLGISRPEILALNQMFWIDDRHGINRR